MPPFEDALSHGPGLRAALLAAALSVAAVLAPAAQPAWARPTPPSRPLIGPLDPSFGRGGVLSSPLLESERVVSGSIAGDDRPVFGTDFARLLRAKGTNLSSVPALPNSFSTPGGPIDLAHGADGSITAARPDGKAVLVARLDRSLDLAAGFGAAGIARTSDLVSGQPQIVQLPGGGAAIAVADQGPPTVAVAKLDSTGAAQAGFGVGGVARIPIPGVPWGTWVDVGAILDDGSGGLLVVGSLSNERRPVAKRFVLRIDAAGAVAPGSFHAIEESMDSGTGVADAALDSKGRLLILERHPDPSLTFAYPVVVSAVVLASGRLDRSFGQSGSAVGEQKRNVIPGSLAVEKGGQIVATGGMYGGVAVTYRFTASGRPDRTLAGTGRACFAGPATPGYGLPLTAPTTVGVPDSVGRITVAASNILEAGDDGIVALARLRSRSPAPKISCTELTPNGVQYRLAARSRTGFLVKTTKDASGGKPKATLRTVRSGIRRAGLQRVPAPVRVRRNESVDIAPAVLDRRGHVVAQAEWVTLPR